MARISDTARRVKQLSESLSLTQSHDDLDRKLKRLREMEGEIVRMRASLRGAWRDRHRRYNGLHVTERPPTTRQSRVLRLIAENIMSHGYPPTIRELCKKMNIRSNNGIADHLVNLERRGLIFREECASRAIRITDKGVDALAWDPPLIVAEARALRPPTEDDE